MEDKVLTLHPEQGKRGVNMSWAKYELMRETIGSMKLVSLAE